VVSALAKHKTRNKKNKNKKWCRMMGLLTRVV
jgi:hypothetical protein